jgi:hypothetical protein
MKTFKEFLILESEHVVVDYTGLNNKDLSDKISDLTIQYDDQIQFHSMEGVINETVLDVTGDDNGLYFHCPDKIYTVDRNYDIVIGPKKLICKI